MQLDAYSGFAEIYDEFMEDVPYKLWCDRICAYLSEQGIEDGLMLDLGCGTGTMTALFAERGYDMIGVDASAEMLEKAREKDADGHILYLLQDIRAFELYGTVRAIVSVCDTMNYLLAEEDLLTAFRLVNNYLDPGGIFLFDMNTIHKYRDIIGEDTICDLSDDAAFIWENDYDEESCVNAYQITFFEKEDDGRYRRFEEIHVQRAYEPENIRALLEQAGLKVLGVYDEDFKPDPSAESERIIFAAQECRKHG